MTGWIQVFGRLHPLVLHLPIGLLIGLAVVEVLAFWRRSPPPREARAILAWLAAAGAVLTAASGWTLSHEPSYGGETIELHERLGIAVAIGSVLVALLQGRERLVKPYRAALLLTVGVLLPGAHLGATITHGDGFLAAPLRARAPAATQGDSRSTYAATIGPIFAANCTSCHGPTKHKGGLSLHTPEAIRKGGEDGPILGEPPVDPAKSEIVRRLKLPLEDEDHMPPSGKLQPSAEEIAAIEAWVAAGAPFEGASPAPPATAPEPADQRSISDSAVERLRNALAHVESVERGSNLLWIDFAAPAARTGDAEAEALLEPVVEHVGQLSLARTRITDATLSLVARMPNLARLDLRGTAVTDAGLGKIAGLAKLEDLVLAQTKLSDAAVDHLAAMPALRKVWLWKSGVGADALSRLRQLRPALAIDAGGEADSAALQVEEKVALAKEKPASAAPAVALAPVNTICPVSGSPVDPAYAIVFKGRVVGFCCAKCPAQFWADPARFESKLP